MEIVDKLKERIAKTELRKKEAIAYYFIMMENQQVLMEGLLELLQRPQVRDQDEEFLQRGAIPAIPTEPCLRNGDAATRAAVRMLADYRERGGDMGRILSQEGIANIIRQEIEIRGILDPPSDSCWMPPELAQGSIEKVVGEACVTSKD